jgi:2-iminobutanoate/2-iminopropanoate deaminase
MRYVPSPDPALPFSSAVIHNGTVYVSGNIGMTTDGTLPSGIEAQARQAMDNLVAALGRAGCTVDDVIKCTIMLEDMRLWRAFNAVYVTYFSAERLPARSAFGTSGLALGALVEIECIARESAAVGST